MESEESESELIGCDFDDDLEIDFGHVAPDSTGGGPNRTDYTDVYQRFGSKKALAPYITKPLILRQFFDECKFVLEKFENSSLLFPFHDSVNAEPTNATETWKEKRERKQELSQERKLRFSLIGDSAEPARKQLKSTMSDLRTRVERSSLAFGQYSFSTDQCISRAPRLITLKNRKVDQQLADKNRSSTLQFTRSLYSSVYVQDIVERECNRKNRLRTLSVPRELIVTVRISRGRPAVKHPRNRNVKDMLVMYCLGSSRLSEVVRHIRCLTETSPANDLSNDDLTNTKLQDNFLYIEKTFFTDKLDDFEESRARHYQDWLATTLSVDAGIEHLDDRPLMDIELSLGTPYLYKHGPAGCEHFVVFSDVRFLHPDDELDLSLYPRVIFEASAKWPVCTICGGRSKWQINNSKRLPRRLNFVCDPCNLVFNYTAEGVQVEPDVVLVSIAASRLDGRRSRDGSQMQDDD